MSHKMLVKTVFINILMLLFYVSFTSAESAMYGFYDTKFIKVETIHGQRVKTALCENKVTLKELGISQVFDSEEIFVSPDERYFVLQGSLGRHGNAQWFLVDLKDCKLVAKLVAEQPNYHAFQYQAAFSDDSKKIYVTWDLLSDNVDIEDALSLTKEYSGDVFKTERILKNIMIPSRVSQKGYPLPSHQFSKDGKYLLVEDYKFPQGQEPIYNVIVYDVIQDTIIAKFNEDQLTTNRRYYEFYYTPDISNDLLLYSFNRSEAGPSLTELAIYDYKNITLKRKINVPLKGIGIFSSSGSRIIFSTFPDTQTWKKDVIVFDTNTGTQIGKASLDEMDKIDDISFDDKQIIYKRNGVEMRIDLVK